MAKKKIYGYPGKVNIVTTIGNGATKALINFTGGSLSDPLNRPATYETSNALNQLIIESSDQFRSGKIRLVAVIDLDGENVVNDDVTSENADEPASAGDAVAEADESDVTVVDAPDKEWAADWLIENYPDKNYTHTKLRTYDMLNSAAAECGVKFNFSK